MITYLCLGCSQKRIGINETLLFKFQDIYHVWTTYHYVVKPKAGMSLWLRWRYILIHARNNRPVTFQIVYSSGMVFLSFLTRETCEWTEWLVCLFYCKKIKYKLYFQHQVTVGTSSIHTSILRSRSFSQGVCLRYNFFA